MIDNEKERLESMVRRAIIVGVVTAENDSGTVHGHLDELAELLENLEVETLERVVVNLKNGVNAKYLIGSGKAEELAARYAEVNAEVLVFDAELTPSQQRNWERLLQGGCVIDRQEVILDIFAERASTREAVLQVELARLRYSLPRLTRAWTHLSRQRGGGATTRGEGEAQIEVDRRLVKAKLTFLEKELETVRKQRSTQRKDRERHEIPHGAIVGYTNAGKSSLLKALSKREMLVADKLFATLDPMTRKVSLPDNQMLLLTDTVGFVRKLPHELVEAFKSTLEEAVLADFLILVLDITSPDIDEHWDTTLSVLKELGADTGEILVVFNKIDLSHDLLARQRARGLFANGLFVSTVTGEGMDELVARLTAIASRSQQVMHLVVPPSRHDLKALAHERGRILESDYDEHGNIVMTLAIGAAERGKFEEFQV